MTEEKDASDLAVAEAGSLGRELARVYQSTVEAVQRLRGLTFQEADSELRKAMSSVTAGCLLARDPVEISWVDLQSLVSGGASLDVWERIKDAAREEEALGISAAKTIEGYVAKPWDRATFLALRSGIVDEWQPRGGLELALIDALATSLYMYRFWLNQHVERATTRAEIQKSDLRERGRRRLPFDWEEEGTTQAAEMADRFHRMAMMTLRALRDLRRFSVSVNIKGAGQVNVAERQLNVDRPRPNRQSWTGQHRPGSGLQRHGARAMAQAALGFALPPADESRTGNLYFPKETAPGFGDSTLKDRGRARSAQGRWTRGLPIALLAWEQE